MDLCKEAGFRLGYMVCMVATGSNNTEIVFEICSRMAKIFQYYLYKFNTIHVWKVSYSHFTFFYFAPSSPFKTKDDRLSDNLSWFGLGHRHVQSYFFFYTSANNFMLIACIFEFWHHRSSICNFSGFINEQMDEIKAIEKALHRLCIEVEEIWTIVNKIQDS